MKGYYRLVVRELEAAGYLLIRYGKGDHQIWQHPTTKKSVVVDRGVVSRHSANGIMKQAGLSKHF